MIRFVIGDPVVVTNTFTVGAVATDPTTITLTVTNPAGVTTSYTYVGSTITRTSAGIYTKTVTTDTVGTWTYKWVGTGPAADVQDGTFLVAGAADDTLYVGLDELKSLLHITDTNDDIELQAALTATCRTIDDWCGRRFYPDTTATARLFRATSTSSVDLLATNGSEFYTTTGLIVETDQNFDRVFEITWSASDYQLEPLNGIIGGTGGQPYNTIVAPETGSRRFPAGYQLPLVQVTAMWGWAAPPEPVRLATKLLAKDLFKNKDTVGGIQGFDNFGAVRIRKDPFVTMLLGPYRYGFGIG